MTARLRRLARWPGLYIRQCAANIFALCKTPWDFLCGGVVLVLGMTVLVLLTVAASVVALLLLVAFAGTYPLPFAVLVALIGLGLLWGYRAYRAGPKP